jgi:hypothetical protein
MMDKINPNRQKMEASQKELWPATSTGVPAKKRFATAETAHAHLSLT